MLFYRDYPTIVDWNHVKYIKMNLCPSIYVFLKQFDIIFPHLTCIKFNMGNYFDMLDKR
jgi:hypothetical protein